MKALLFKLERIPDLTLVKYSNLGIRGVDGVLDAHQGFLRLFNRKPDTSLHLLYVYDPTAPDGSRLSVDLIVCDTSVGSASGGLDDVGSLVSASPLSPFFNLSLPSACLNGAIDPEQLPPLIGFGGHASHFRFRWMSSMAKQSKFVRQQPPSPEAPNGFFTLLNYEQEDSGRLLALMRLMEAIGEQAGRPLAYRVDLYPTSRAETLRDSLPLAIIKSQQQGLGGRRDYTLEGVERSYEDTLKTLESSQLFHVNLFAFASDGEGARALLDAASSEAIKKGAVTTALFEGDWGATSFLTGDHWARKLESVDGGTVLIPRIESLGSRRIYRPGYVHVDRRAENYPHSDMQSLFTLAEAATLFRLPTLNDGESVQIRKETAPPPVAENNAIYLGIDSSGQKAFFDMKLLSKHAFIAGVPGSGKTNTMHHLASSLVNAGVPILVLEPAKHEYRALLNVDHTQEIRVFAPGGELAFPIRINPFQIPLNVTVGHHISRLCTVFQGAFPLEGALPFILDRSIEAVYAAHGWDPKDRCEEGHGKDWPTLTELYHQMEIELDRESYGGEVKGNLASALRMRIGGLLRRELGELFDVAVSTYEPSSWLRMSAVVELEGLGRPEANFVTLLLLVLIRESLMVDPDYRPKDGAPPIRHAIFVEEAHNLIGPDAETASGEDADPKKAATAFLSDMLREVRAYGEGLVIADQLPTAIAPEVLKNTGLKIALRMTSSDDRELLGSMMAANGVQLERMAVANPGEALVLYEDLQRPFELMMAEWLNVKGTREYVKDMDARRALSVSLPAGRLAERLIASESSWYTDVRLSVPSGDILTFRKRLESLDMKYQDVFVTLERWGRVSAEMEITSREFQEETRRTSMRLRSLLDMGGATGATKAASANLNPVLEAYYEAERAFISRCRGWAYLGMPLFRKPNTIPADAAISCDLMVETAALRGFSVCEADVFERYATLYEQGVTWLHSYLGNDGIRRARQEARQLRKYIEVARDVDNLYRNRMG